jgi:hypothetical protein
MNQMTYQSEIEEIFVSASLWLYDTETTDQEANAFRHLLLGLAGWQSVDVALVRCLKPARRQWIAALIANLNSLDEATLILAAGGKVPSLAKLP